MFSATVSVSNSAKCWNTMPMPSRRAAAGDAKRDGLAFPFDLAGIGAHDAVCDLHQRALARAVLADQAVDLAGAHDEIDAVVGNDGGVALYDSAKGQARRRGGHR